MQIDFMDIFQVASFAAAGIFVFHLKKKMDNAIECLEQRIRDMHWDVSRLIVSDRRNHPETSAFVGERSFPAIFEAVMSKYLKDRGLSRPEGQGLSHQSQQCPTDPSQTSHAQQQNSAPTQPHES